MPEPDAGGAGWRSVSLCVATSATLAPAVLAQSPTPSGSELRETYPLHEGTPPEAASGARPTPAAEGRSAATSATRSSDGGSTPLVVAAGLALLAFAAGVRPAACTGALTTRSKRGGRRRRRRFQTVAIPPVRAEQSVGGSLQAHRPPDVKTTRKRGEVIDRRERGRDGGGWTRQASSARRSAPARSPPAARPSAARAGTTPRRRAAAQDADARHPQLLPPARVRPGGLLPRGAAEKARLDGELLTVSRSAVVRQEERARRLPRQAAGRPRPSHGRGRLRGRD